VVVVAIVTTRKVMLVVAAVDNHDGDYSGGHDSCDGNGWWSW